MAPLPSTNRAIPSAAFSSQGISPSNTGISTEPICSLITSQRCWSTCKRASMLLSMRRAMVRVKASPCCCAAPIAWALARKASCCPHRALKNFTASSLPKAFCIWPPISVVYCSPNSCCISVSKSGSDLRLPFASRVSMAMPICRKRACAWPADRSKALRVVPATPASIFCCSIPSAVN